ncbi:hypothetical protein IW261DRAFT_1570314 [Armillaria novae-zelandiae]|uniref:Uncharacterized protein n=1 Tax=Armillaria novae-zelandiae TaxID=153914 RepID=A0AA39NW50_9AGAR|nr:hypothetical protein IW261DRAFT_1570314 [Armillaria novae-zelandiae]
MTRSPSTRNKRTPRPADEPISYTDYLNTATIDNLLCISTEAASCHMSHSLSSSISNMAAEITTETDVTKLCDFILKHIIEPDGEEPEAPKSLEIPVPEILECKSAVSLAPETGSVHLVMVNVYVDAAHRITEYTDTTLAEHNPTLAALLEPILSTRNHISELILDAIHRHPDVHYVVGSSAVPVICHRNFLRPTTFHLLGSLLPDSLLRAPGSRVPCFACPQDLRDELGILEPTEMLTLSIFPELLTEEHLDLPISQRALVDADVFQPSGFNTEATKLQHAVPVFQEPLEPLTISSSGDLLATPSPTMTTTHLVAENPAPPPHTENPTTPLADWIRNLLEKTFGEKIMAFELLRSSQGYQTAYLAVLEDEFFAEICKDLFPPCQVAGVVDFEGRKYQISLPDIHSSILGKISSGSRNRSTLIGHAHRAHRALRCNESTLTPAELQFLHILNTMFRHQILGPQGSHPVNSFEDMTVIALL